MSRENDDVSLSKNDFYDSIIMDSEAMKKFIKNYDSIEIVLFYRYVLDKAKILSILDPEGNKEMISYCWLASIELEATDAIQDYLSGKISQPDIEEYQNRKEAQINEIVELVEQKRREKNSITRQISRMFRGK